MEGDGMVAVVRGLREAGLTVTLLDGNRQYTLLPNTITQPASTQRAAPKTIVHASTQQCPKFTADISTGPATAQCDREAQAVDGRYASMYKTTHCNVRPTSPPVQLTEFPPQRPDLYPGHGNFIVGGSGSGANGCPIRSCSPINSFRGGMSWPDRGSVCSPQPSRMEDAFVRSLRKYPNCLSPDRSSEVMERLVNYSQAKGSSRHYRNSSPNRSSDPSSQNVIESKAFLNMATRSRFYDPDVNTRARRNEDPPTRDRRNDDYDRPVRGGSYDVRYLRDVTKRIGESGGRPYTSYPYSHPVCPPTIRETHDCHPLSCDYQNSSNSVNIEVQAAVQMLSKEVATLPRVDEARKTVAVPESPISSAGEDYVEGEFYYVENMDIRTSIKSIQTNFYPSGTALKPRKSAQTVFSTIDFHSSRNRTIVSRKTKSQDAIKLTKDELKISLLELINEISDTVSKNTIRDELIRKLFDTSERTDHICDRAKIKHDKCLKYVEDYCPTVCDYVGDYQELVGKLKHCYGDANNVLRSEIKPFRLSEYRQLDFVLKDWVNHLNLQTDDIGRSIDRRNLLTSVEDRIKGLLKNWTKEDFDLKSEIVEILQEIPIEVNKSYGMKSYLRKLVDVLLKRMRNVIVTEQTGRVRRRPFASRSKKILTEEDMRDFVREHLLNYANENNSIISNEFLMYDLENELVDLMMDSIECIWCGHDDEIMDEMEIILQDLGKMSNKHANYISNLMLQDLQDMLNNCIFNQTYTILNVSNNSRQYMNSTNNTDFSIGSITEEDLQANLDSYTNQLSLQINQWLDDLDILQIEDSGFREVVVNDLAGDIIDRYKYVELNLNGRDSDQDQLEALKYQIFKWINKLVGDDNQETINHAENLLQRINSVPVPMLVNPKHRSAELAEVDKSACCSNVDRSTPKPYSQPVQSKPSCGKETCSKRPKDGKGISTRGPFDEMNNFPNAGASKPQAIQGQSARKSCRGGTYKASCSQVQSSLNNSRPCGRSFGPASSNNPWGCNTFSFGFTGNLSQPRKETVSGSGNGPCGTCTTNQPTMQYPNQLMNASSSNRPGGSVPVKKLNEDYDEYLKQWVKKIPIAEKTEEESARLNVYNGIWKAVTMMKLDPNIFGNQYYCQDVLEENVERLLQGVPQSQELKVAKPVLKAQLLHKTLAMNDLIKSTNAPASFKQQLMDNIENNLPERAPTKDEEDQANDELDKQNMADYYILYTRYKNEENVKATVHRKNFLKKLDEYLNKIKNRHNLVGMETTAYANEIINSLEKIPTPNLSAIKDEADEILLAMEVENWISDIPQTTSVTPIEKRRARDAIVKKIQEIGLRGAISDNAVRVALKAELPKNLEKLPIQEGTNKDYLIDELANRIKNLSTSMRRVSFQEPEDYEEFSRNIPGASSMHDMTGDRSSYLIAGENIVKCSPRQVGMRLGGGRQHSVLEEDIQWLSMDRTEVPSQMRSGYVAPQGRQSLQVYNPNESGQMPQRPQSPQMCAPDCSAPPGKSNVSGGNISRDASPNRTWGSERVPVPQKRQKMSMQESRASPYASNRSGRPESAHSQLYNPNDSLAGRCCPGQGNFGSDAGPRLSWAVGQTPVIEEQIRQAGTQRSYPGSQVPSIFNPNTQVPFAPVSDVPFSSFPNAADQSATQRNYSGRRLNWAGDQRSIPEEDIQWYSMEATEMPSQMRSMSIESPSARSSSVCGTTQGQLPPNLQGQALCTGPPSCSNSLCNNRTQGSLGSGPYSQPALHSPDPRRPYGQGSTQYFPNVQGSPNASQTSPLPQEQFGQGSPGRFNQSVSPAFEPLYQPPGIGPGQTPVFPNNTLGQSFDHNAPCCQGGLGPRGQMPCQGPIAPQLGQAMPNVPGSLQNGQASIGVIEGIAQGFSIGQPNVCQGNSTLNQTSHSPGPISAASQVHEQAASPNNVKMMAGGRMGILGTNQGPSSQSVVPTCSGLGATCYQGVGTDAIPAIPITTCDRSIQQPCNQNQSIQKPSNQHQLMQQPAQNRSIQQPCLRADKSLQASCIPAVFLGRPKGCFAPDRDREKETKCKCMRSGRKFRPRIQIDPNDDQIEYLPCRVHEKNARKEPKNNKVKEVDVKEKQVFNFKSVQTALSTIDITTTKCKYYEMRSKSQVELTQTTNKQEVVKRTGHSHEDLHQEVTEWFEIHSDKVRVKLWGEKMKKLAEKLKKPGGEEKLRSKIEKFLKQAPETSTEADSDIVEFRKQLPNNIVRKLKKMYSSPKEPNVNIYRLEVPKYCSRVKIDNFKKAVLNWMKTLSIKKKDFLGRNVKKDDVFKFVAEKLEPVVLDRPQSDSEYKEALQSSITEIVYELPIAVSSHNRDLYLNQAINNLVENIFTIENKFSSTYIQPTTKEIKEFVKDEITFFLEKCRVAISTKRMEYLEIELVNRLLDLTDITDIDSSVADDVTKLLKEVSELPQYKAKYFTNLILKDYKEFFFRENFFQQKGNSECGRPEVLKAFQNATGLVDLDKVASFETYKKQLIEEISKWLTKLNIPINDKNVMEVAVNELAGDIVDRYKYLLLNPSLIGKDAEELEQLKFQIFKWTNKLIGEENTTVLEHAQELMNEINKIPKPSLQDTGEIQSLSPLNTDEINNTSKPYIDKLTDEIYDWYCELSVDFHVSQDTRHNKILIKELAQEIEKGLEKKEDGFTDKAVRKWTEKVFNKRLGYNEVQQLINRINNVPYTNDSRANDLKLETNLIRCYEDIVYEWIDRIPIEPIKLRLFISNKIEIIHSLAVKIFKFKSKLKQLPAGVVEKKLQEELSHWLKKLPLHVKVDNQNDRDKYAAKLAKSIQSQSINDFFEKDPNLSDEPVILQLENVVLDWLKKLPLYREKSPEERKLQETAIKELAFKLSQTIGNDDADVDKEIIQQIRMLDPEQNEDNVQNMAFRLKLYLQKLDLYKELCKQREKENKLLVDTIEVWLKDLSLEITDVEGFHKQKVDFIKSVKKLISSGSDNAVMKKEILIFMKTLPMSHSKKHDLKYLNAEVSKLVKSLNREPIGDVPSLSSDKSNEMISDAIKVWTSTLPLKPVYCLKELRSITDNLCSVITSILLDPDQNSTREQNYVRLYREIAKFLRRFPLIYGLSTESHIFGMAAELSKSLKNISLFRDDKYSVNNMTVYDVSVKNNTNDHSIEESNINKHLEAYTKQLVQQISEWFDRLYLPEGNQGYKEVVINDLATDIVDRHKYLELNPNNTLSEQDEIEHLKYQIFKCINKLVGEENKETIAHAEELMQRVKTIPVPMLVRPRDKGQAESHSPRRLQYYENNHEGQQSKNTPSAQQGTSNRMGPANPTSKPFGSQEPPPAPTSPEESRIDAMCQKFVTVFTDHCNALPLDDSTPYAKIARQTMVNGILLTFFKLKADPVIENDYGYFEFLLEGKIDKLLNELPQTEALQKMRHSWKTRVLESALRLLDEMHSGSDRPSFRQNVKNNFNRQLAIDNDIQNCFVLQQNFLNSVADAYILQVNYKEKDPVKANIYKNRLMGEVDKLVNHLTKEHNAGFRLFKQSKLRRIAMKALEQVPVPADDILQDEVEEIHLADEIEKWYKELPTKPSKSEEENVAIKRMIDLLAKKLNDMHKHLNDDNLSMEDKMKHEVSHFLEKRKTIRDDYDHKITDMVDLLFLRLKDRWAPVQDPEGFDEFAKAKPLSSTLAHVDNAEFLAPLMNVGTSTSPQTAGQGTFGDSGYFIRPDMTTQDMERVPLCSLISSGLDPNVSRQVRSPRVNFEGCQFGLRQDISHQSPQRPSLSQQVQSPKQARQSPQSVQNTTYPSPNTGRGTCQSSQGREQCINQSLRQGAFGGQMGPQGQRDRNMAGQVQKPCGMNKGQVECSNRTDQGQIIPGNSIPGPTFSRGIGTTAEEANGGTGATCAPVSSDEDVLKGKVRVKCRCLEAYRRLRSMDYDERCNMFMAYGFPY